MTVWVDVIRSTRLRQCPLFALSGRPESTYCGRSGPRPWTGQLGGYRAFRGRLGNDRSVRQAAIRLRARNALTALSVIGAMNERPTMPSDEK
jgi:hypothetical protein